MTHIINVMCGGGKPPTSKRADFIILPCDGQAFRLLIFLGALVEQGEHVDFFTVEKNAG